MSYGGDVSAKDCWLSLDTDQNAQLVDVRTVPEWQFVGVPDLSGINKEVIAMEWQHYPEMQINTGFAGDVSDRLEQLECGKGNAIYMLCRSGVRSIAAAQNLTSVGYTKVFNVLHGFEGDKDQFGQRGKTTGWKFDGLPWKQ